MKDKEFIELLNLYLDHEISPADAGRLEAEVQRNPARYRIYRDYCRLHKGCTLLSADFGAEAPVATVVQLPSRVWPNPFAIAGLLAAAACATFVFLNQSSPVATNGPLVAEHAVVAPAAPTNTAIAAEKSVNGLAQTAVSPRVEAQPLLVKHTFRLTENEASTDVVADARLNWIDTLKLSSVPPVPAESLRFETKTAPKNPQRSFGPASFDGPLEYNAIQFQR